MSANDYPHPIPPGRIRQGTTVFWQHAHAGGRTEISGRVARYYAGSRRYGVETARGERTPYASVLEFWNPASPRVAAAQESTP